MYVMCSYIHYKIINVVYNYSFVLLNTYDILLYNIYYILYIYTRNKYIVNESLTLKCEWLCMYTCIYTHTYIHTHIYIYTQHI